MALRNFTYISNEGYVTEQAPTDELSLGKVTVVGVSGIGLDMGSSRLVSLADPTNPTDGVNLQTLQLYVAGLRDLKESVRVKTTGANITLAGGAPNTLDGVTLAANDRILVTDQTAPAENGLYTVQTLGTGSNGTWVRAADADTSAEVTAGMYCTIEEGTLYADTQWVLSTNNPIVLGTTGLTFIWYSSVKDLTAGAGISKTGNQIDVELATISGLEFDAAGAAGKLRWDPDTARGLAMDATGAYIALATSNPGVQFVGGLLDAKLKASAGLSKDASGILVLLDPTINNLGVGAGGLFVTKSPAMVSRLVASGAIAAFAAVYWSGSNVVSSAVPSTDASARIIGVAAAAISNAATGEVVSNGTVVGALSGATAGTVYYAHPTTGLPVVRASVTGATRLIKLGVAQNATDLWVDIEDYGRILA